MPTYDADDFVPPAPVARVSVSVADGVAETDVPMLLDTGADVSVVPQAVADRLGVVAQASGVLLQMFDGSQREALVADVRVDVLRYRFRGRFVIALADYGILGRDVLNSLVVTFDGPGFVWEIL
jgi:hypothetical protein